MYSLKTKASTFLCILDSKKKKKEERIRELLPNKASFFTKITILAFLA